MTNKKLIKRSARWSQKLLKFNFKIMYQTKSRNVKVNALTRMLDIISKDKENDRLK